MLSHEYNIIIYRSVGSTGQGREVVDGLNVTYKETMYVNGQSEMDWLKVFWKSYGNSYLNKYRRRQSRKRN